MKETLENTIRNIDEMALELLNSGEDGVRYHKLIQISSTLNRIYNFFYT